MHAPAFDGHTASFANCEEKVATRNQIATMEPQQRAANLLLHMTDVARKVCLAAGKDVVSNIDGVAQISRILRERPAPDAIDSIFQDIMKFSRFKRPGQNMDTFPVEFDMSRQEPRSAWLWDVVFPTKSLRPP